MSRSAFLDTNVLVYAFDETEPTKRAIARGILRDGAAGGLVLSTQVLGEFCSCAMRKFRPVMRAEEIARLVREFAALPLVEVDVPVILEAVSRAAADRISFWDAIHVEAARRAGCERLLTEDLQHGRVHGGVRIENPFLGATGGVAEKARRYGPARRR